MFSQTAPSPIPKPLQITQHPFMDLLGVPFIWKGRTLIGCDCLGFASIVSQRVSHRPFRLWAPLLEDYYKRHPAPPAKDEEILPLAHQLLEKRKGPPKHGDLVIIKSGAENCLSTYLEHGEERYLAAMFRSGSRVIPLERIQASNIVGVFEVAKILVPLKC